MVKVCICGGGNGGHVAAGLLPLQGHDVTILCTRDKHLAAWNEGIASGGVELLYSAEDNPTGKKFKGCPRLATTDPEEAVSDADVVFIILPTFLHERVIKSISPFLKDSAWVGVVEGAWFGKPPSVFGPRAEALTFFALQCLPWACRIQEYGKSVEVFATKDTVDLAVSPQAMGAEVSAAVGAMLGLRLPDCGSLLGLAMSCPCNTVHPCIMRGLFGDWDGTPMPEAPLFYQGVTDSMCETIEAMTGELMALRRELEARYPTLNLSAIRGVKQYLLEFYDGQIGDTSSMRSCFNTNAGYNGLRAPMLPASEEQGGPAAGLVPRFDYRYLNSDLPYGLMMTRGVAELAGVAMPVIDEVIEWAQSKIGKEYMVGGRVAGRDLDDTHAPQKYGCRTLDEFIAFCDRSLLPEESRGVAAPGTPRHAQLVAVGSSFPDLTTPTTPSLDAGEPDWATQPQPSPALAVHYLPPMAEVDEAGGESKQQQLVGAPAIATE